MGYLGLAFEMWSLFLSLGVWGSWHNVCVRVQGCAGVLGYEVPESVNEYQGVGLCLSLGICGSWLGKLVAGTRAVGLCSSLRILLGQVFVSVCRSQCASWWGLGGVGSQLGFFSAWGPEVRVGGTDTLVLRCLSAAHNWRQGWGEG